MGEREREREEQWQLSTAPGTIWAYPLWFEHKAERLYFLLVCALRAYGYFASAVYPQVRFLVLCLSFPKQISLNTRRSARFCFLVLCRPKGNSGPAAYLHVSVFVFSALVFKNRLLQIQGGVLVLRLILHFAGLPVLCLSCVSACAYFCALPWISNTNH